LQRLFIGVLFEATQAEYHAQGVAVEDIGFTSNQDIVDLIGGLPNSLMAMLTEECIFPKGSDVLYLQKACRAHRDHESFKELKANSTAFALRHYAGEVAYTVTDFLSKNKDPVSQDLVVLMQCSKNAFLSSLMKPAAPKPQQAGAAQKAGGGRFKSSKFVGVVDRFQTSLRTLISTLQGGEMHFIRCLKPNDGKMPGKWDKATVSRQLASSGIVSAVHASRAGFADHLSPAQIVAQFAVVAQTATPPGCNDSEAAAAVLQACGVDEGQFAVGRTKVFLRQGVLSELERQRLELIGKQAARSQALVRGFIDRRRVQSMREEWRRAEEERARLEEERRRAAEARRRAAEEARAREEAERKRFEEEEAARRKEVQMARSFSFDRRRKKAKEEEERRVEEERRAAISPEHRQQLAEQKRAEAEERHRQRLAQEGLNADTLVPSVTSEASTTQEPPVADDGSCPATPVAKAAVEAAAPAAPSDSVFAVPALPTKPTALQQAAAYASEHLQLVCPLSDVVSYASYIGMQLPDDSDLLWIADEALQAAEPVGWEECQDPNGGTYFHNPVTGMSMEQHPVDYHYHQIYLQMKQEKGRTRVQASGKGSANAKGSFALDLRSVNTDADDGPDPGTPTGWLKRAKSLLTPRGSNAGQMRRSSAADVDQDFTSVHAIVRRSLSERLGMELNAYNQILAISPGSPCARCPDVQLHDRVLAIDDQVLGDRLLSDVIRQATEHKLVLERCVRSKAEANSFMQRLSPRSQRPKAEVAASPSRTSKSRGKRPPLPPNSPAGKFDRFQVVIPRGPAGLGLVCDDDAIVVDMVPGSTADLQRTGETKNDPRLQIGDRIVCVDGASVSGQTLEDLMQPGATQHTFLAERPKTNAQSASSGTSFAKALKVLTPRPSSAPEVAKVPSKGPSRALREVVLHKDEMHHRLGIRFVRDDDGFDRDFWAYGMEVVQPIVAALDPAGAAAAAGVEVDDMVLSINGQTGLTNTQAAGQLRDLTGAITLVLRKAGWTAAPPASPETPRTSMPETPRSAMRRLV